MPTLNTIANLGRKLAQTDLPKVPRRGGINMSYPTNAAQMALETASRNQERIRQDYENYGINPTVEETVMYGTPLVGVPFAVGVGVDALSFPASQVRNVYNTAADAINAGISAHNRRAYDRRLEAAVRPLQVVPNDATPEQVQQIVTQNNEALGRAQEARRLEAKSKIVGELGRLRDRGELFSDLNRTMALIDLYNKVK